MIRTLLCIVIFLFVNYVDSQISNGSFVCTPINAHLCKEHICKDGYNYRTFYRVDSPDHREIKKDSETAFEMHLGIQAASNGHILLSSIPKPGYNDTVYEIDDLQIYSKAPLPILFEAVKTFKICRSGSNIPVEQKIWADSQPSKIAVVGGGGNQFTELRSNLKRNARSSVKTPRILSSFEVRWFFIKISQDGIIEFGKEGETLPLLTFLDHSPLEIKYFSFAAWTGVEAKFMYDCPIPTGNGTTTPDSQEVDRPLSTSDQLKRMQLIYRLPWIPPKPTMDVRLGIKVTNVKYNAFESKMITTMSIVTSWTDDSMAWYPVKYNGTTSLKFRQGQIWRPKFYVYNSDNADMLDARNPDLISMVYSGEATFHFQTEVQTWCTDSAPGLSKWPHDKYMCHIVIQPWEPHEKINIEIIDPKDRKMHIFSDVDEVIENEWMVSTSQLIVKPSVWNKVYINDDNQTHQSDRLFINVELQRRATAYNIVFYTPLLVLTVFVLMSFWTEPLTMDRVWFLAGCTVVICMGLCYVDCLIPSHTMPSILVLYTAILVGVLLALLIQVLLIKTLTENIRKSERIQKIMTAYIFRTIFCLPAYNNMQTSDRNGGYFLQENEEPQTTPIVGEIEEMESENQRTYGDKKEFATVVDRILFVIYSITFASMLTAHY